MKHNIWVCFFGFAGVVAVRSVSVLVPFAFLSHEDYSSGNLELEYPDAWINWLRSIMYPCKIGDIITKPIIIFSFTYFLIYVLLRCQELL